MIWHFLSGLSIGIGIGCWATTKYVIYLLNLKKKELQSKLEEKRTTI